MAGRSAEGLTAVALSRFLGHRSGERRFPPRSRHRPIEGPPSRSPPRALPPRRRPRPPRPRYPRWLCVRRGRPRVVPVDRRLDHCDRSGRHRLRRRVRVRRHRAARGGAAVPLRALFARHVAAGDAVGVWAGRLPVGVRDPPPSARLVPDRLAAPAGGRWRSRSWKRPAGSSSTGSSAGSASGRSCNGGDGDRRPGRRRRRRHPGLARGRREFRMRQRDAVLRRGLQDPRILRLVGVPSEHAPTRGEPFTG